MPSFEYEALDHDGGVKTGVISADTARLARRQLRQNRLMPVRLDSVGDNRARVSLSLPAWTRRARINPATIMVLTRQLATMVSAAAPIEEALHTIALQSDSKAVRSTMLSIRASVMEGFRLADAMAQHGDVFSPLYRALVGAGELSGNLGAVLERLADHLEKSERLRAKVKAALIYPVVLAAVAAIVVAILMVFVVPKVVAQFDGMAQELPLITRALIAVSDGLSRYGIAGLVGLVLAGAGCAFALKREPVRYRLDRLLLDLPVIGKLLRGLHAARLARTLSTLIVGGSPLVEGLSAAKSTVSNLVLLEAVGRVSTAIKEGSSFSSALRRTNIFPPMVVYMSAVGENTGKLDVMLTKAADHLENEFETFTSAAIALLEPLIVVAMGGIVAVIMLAILMPILQLNSLALL
jgi:general secretion pathway protein F